MLPLSAFCFFSLSLDSCSSPCKVIIQWQAADAVSTKRGLAPLTRRADALDILGGILVVRYATKTETACAGGVCRAKTSVREFAFLKIAARDKRHFLILRVSHL